MNVSISFVDTLRCDIGYYIGLQSKHYMQFGRCFYYVRQLC